MGSTGDEVSQFTFTLLKVVVGVSHVSKASAFGHEDGTTFCQCPPGWHGPKCEQQGETF